MPRPRAIRGEHGRRWRPLVFKLLIGAAVASVAVALQDRMPRLEIRGVSLVSSSTPTTLLTGQLRGHKGAVIGVAFTDDGRSIATAGADGTLKLWNASSGGLVRSLDAGAGAAGSLAVLGRRAVTGHGDGRILLWDLDRGERLATFRRNEANIWSVAFAGDPGRVLASSHDWSVALWDARAGESPVHVFEGHESAAQAVAYSARGPFIASGGADRTVRLWSSLSLSLVRTYRGHRNFVTALAFSGDGRLLASAGLDGSIRLWSTVSFRLQRMLPGHRGRIGGLAFAPSGEHLASCGDDGIVKLWDIRRGRIARTMGSGGPAARALAFAPDGRRLAVAGEDGIVRLWDATLPPRARDD